MEKVEKTSEQWREKLGLDAYQVCREAGTERPFTGEYWDCKKQGIYHCRCCDAPLFDSNTKYDSGSGWPSFYDAIDKNQIVITRDMSHGMIRDELRCARCDSHLGHIFADGPNPTGQRYCINSLSLTLTEKSI